MTFDAEEFSAWRDQEITRALFKALRLKAHEARETWLARSWDAGDNDPLLLADLRARAEIAGDICELTYEELEAIIDSQHERH